MAQKPKRKIIEIKAGAYGHWCPGCKRIHYFYTSQYPFATDKVNFNGDLVTPTVTTPIRQMLDAETIKCHYLIHSGQIVFCGDSQHALANKTVPLIAICDIPDEV